MSFVWVKVCNFCSVQNPDSTNEMDRQHTSDDPWCKNMSNLECPSCERRFKTQSDLQDHIARQHDLSLSMPSLISEADDSSWKYMNCSECGGRFENEMDLQYHKTRVHDYGETGNIYPCDQCGFQGADLLALKTHKKDEHDKSKMYNGRIKQNLLHINFDEDSDDDNDWSPSPHDEEALEENLESSNNKRKRKATANSQPIKKSKPDHTCPNCSKSFSRKDSLQRHLKNICNK